KYKTTQELWVAILKTFGGNEATKKTMKNLLKQQYGNFKAEGSETLEQTFNRLQVIVGQLQFMDVEIEQDDLNQKFLTSLAPEWCMHTIVWRNMSDLDTISLDDLYNHLKAPKALMAIDGVGWDWSYMENDGEDHALVADEEAPTEFALMANTSTESKKLEILKKEKEGVVRKLAGFLTASNDLNNLIKSQRADKNKDGIGYSDVPPPPAQIYSSPKKDLSWTGLPEFADDTVTDYSRPSPTMESTSGDDQNINPSVSETEASPSAITPKPFIKFVKESDSPTKSKIDKAEKAKKSPVKYAEQYRKTNKKPNVRGNQRNWNNLKSHQLGPDFVMKKKACFNCGDFNHLAYDCRKRVKKGTSRYQDDTHKSLTPKPGDYRPYKPSQRPIRSNMNGARPNKTSFNKKAHSYANRPFQRTSAVRSQYKAPWVPTVNKNLQPVNKKISTSSRNFPIANRNFPTASRKFPTGSTKCSIADMGMKGKAVKPSACWLWKPSQNLSNKGNISYLSDYEPFDGGYVSFSQGGCKITGKGTIKTCKLEFENVYFVKDLKDFKLLDDANILLRTPRSLVWKLVKDFIPMGSKEEAERIKRKGFNLEQEKAKKQKTLEEVPDKEKSPEEILEEKVKEMMQLVPIEEVYVQALQSSILSLTGREDLNQLWVLVKEYLSIRLASSDKEMELWVELKRLYEPDLEDQLWAQTQNYIHAPIEWKLYDLSRVHHVIAKDKEIFMLVEKDYPLRKGLALVMISYKL
nr:hypothetical protein [Tanacetum cinerariifolium]